MIKMCLSIPGKIVKLEENGDCVVDYEAEKRDVKVLTPGFEVGDYVIVSNKVVVMKVPENQAQDYLNAIRGY